MTSEYSRSVLRVVVAQICQTIGWHSINSSPLEFLVDLMHEYLLRVSKLTHQYSEVLGRTEANLDDLGLAFRHMNISVEELAEYVKNVDSIPCPVSVPKLPIHRDTHLNFLKPGSREVVTRPVHVHEHLPAMYPETEEYTSEKPEVLTNGLSDSPTSNGVPTGSSDNPSSNGSTAQGVFKRPVDPVSFESPITKRPKLTEEGRPLREIHSVMMTTSGFLSPAREGKLPEARTPQQARSDSPPPSSYPMVPPELKTDKVPKKVVKKTPEGRKLDKENKKKNRAKELFKPDEVKKLTGMKELAKLKALKPGGGKAPGPSNRPGTPKLAQTKTASPKVKLTQPKVKPEKVVDTQNNAPISERKDENVDKVPSEPDKRKLNIFKKISKTEKEPEQHKQKALDSREASPPLIIDVEDRHTTRVDLDIKREDRKTPHTPDVLPDGDADDFQSPSSNVYMFDNMSPPGTPSTPKTPDVTLPVPVEPKRKKKERVNKKKEPKVKTPKGISPKKVKMPVVPADIEMTERPKTPHVPDHPTIREQPNIPVLPFPFYPPYPAPGLIPHPIGLPMFSRFPLPLPKGVPGPHPGIPNLPIPPRFLNPPMKPEDYSLPKTKTVDREKPILPPFMEIAPVKSEKVEKEKIVKVKQDKEVPVPIPPPAVPTPVVHIPSVIPPISLPIAPSVPIKPVKAEKLEKNDKKSKEHKKEKKDKIKKKKDKKEKHKEKGEKMKEKKEKGEKKEKLEKIKEKKEKREKRKEKDLNKKTVKEEKAAVPLEVGVPKLTLKLGTSSPRPPTPDSAPMKKITIKPLLKKPEEEAAKREPSPELAKISALVTRPPKQKTPSKKTEERNLDLNPTLSSDSSFSTNNTSVSPATVPRPKRSSYKPLASPPIHSYSSSPSPSPPLPQEQLEFYYVHDEAVRYITISFHDAEVKPVAVTKKEDTKEDKENGGNILKSPPTTATDQSGNQVWICPACGKQDDGSPMIGCDDCDAWYHWVCVGMQVPPAPNEDWYCRQCLTKKQELHHDKKKKKRKKKVKVPA